MLLHIISENSFNPSVSIIHYSDAILHKNYSTTLKKQYMVYCLAKQTNLIIPIKINSETSTKGIH
jgi:hypothetical protein